MNKQSVIATIFLAVTLGLVFSPSVYAWNPSPVITFSSDAGGNTVIAIVFSFAEMSNPPTSSHHPIEFQVRTSADGSSWTELPSVSLSPWPTTTLFTETYNLGSIGAMIQVQARLKCIIHGWSSWGPDPATPVPEFPIPITAVTSALLLAVSVFLFRRKNPAISTP